ncbi:unnamed protein product [Mucor hiemalis]
MPNNMKKPSNNDNKQGNVRSSTKRPRAPIACFRCHHKKVRCDGAHPNCMRCSSTGVLCAYPSSRRSRTTQPTNIDPFIDNLSHLEARIRRIETDLENQRSMVHSMVSPTTTVGGEATAHELNSKMLKTEIEVQDSRSILAQLRLRGEQRISRGKRAAAAAAAAATAAANNTTNNEPVTEKEEKIKNRQQSSTKSTSSNKTSIVPKKVKESLSTSTTSSIDSDKTITPSSLAQNSRQAYPSNNAFYFQGMMLDNNPDLSAYDQPPGHGMDWTLFDQQHQQKQPDDYNMDTVEGINNLFVTHSSTVTNNSNQQLLFPEQQKAMMDISPGSSRSSSLTSNLGYPVVLHPSNSTTSTTSATTCSSMNSCENIFGFPMVDEMMLQHPTEPLLSQGI